jgi:hypothetical protein
VCHASSLKRSTIERTDARWHWRNSSSADHSSSTSVIGPSYRTVSLPFAEMTESTHQRLTYCPVVSNPFVGVDIDNVMKREIAQFDSPDKGADCPIDHSTSNQVNW